MDWDINFLLVDPLVGLFGIVLGVTVSSPLILLYTVVYSGEEVVRCEVVRYEVVRL